MKKFLFFIFALVLSLNSFALINDEELIIKKYEGADEQIKIERITNFKDINCLAKNIYYESRGQSFDGKLAVGQVTLNRVNSGVFPNTVCGVVYQKVKKTCQFSWVCDPNVNKSPKGEEWIKSKMIAEALLTGSIIHDKIQKTKALFFHNVQVRPNWSNTLQRVSKIGGHIFYTNKKRKNRYDN